MNKKKFFSKSMVFVVLGLLAVSGVMAALVTYLSDTANMDVNVQSPTEISYATVPETDEWADVATAITTVNGYVDEDWTSAADLGDTTGLSTSYLGVRINNNADVDIDGKTLNMVVTNTNTDVTCDDFSSFTMVDTTLESGDANYLVAQEFAGTPACSEAGGVVTFEIPVSSLTTETNHNFPVTMTFGNVEPSAYAIEAQLME